MRWSRARGVLAIGFLAVLTAGTLAAQDGQEASQRIEHREQRVTEGVEQSAGANTGVAHILTETTENAAHTAETWGRRFGLGKDASFGISVALNFLGIVVFCWWISKSALPRAFRQRRAEIQKGIRDAQAAGADAARRLTEIEARLGKLDSEVAAIRQSAEHEAAAEEERIREAAEHDKERIVEGAQAEIEAMTRNARRELKGYAASLAVDLAGRQIRVDDSTDHVLVRDFVGQLGKDGQ
jgi:F-type H+-transporting ATPase subunit b